MKSREPFPQLIIDIYNFATVDFLFQGADVSLNAERDTHGATEDRHHEEEETALLNPDGQPSSITNGPSAAVSNGVNGHGPPSAAVSNGVNAHGPPSAAVSNGVNAHGPPSAAVSNGVNAHGPPSAAISNGVNAHGPPSAAVSNGVNAHGPPSERLHPVNNISPPPPSLNSSQNPAESPSTQPHESPDDAEQQYKSPIPETDQNDIRCLFQPVTDQDHSSGITDLGNPVAHPEDEPSPNNSPEMIRNGSFCSTLPGINRQERGSPGQGAQRHEGTPVAHEPFGQDTILKQPVDTIPKQPVGDDTSLKQPVGDDTILKQPAGKDTIPKQPAGKDTIPKRPVGKDTIPREPAGGDTILKQPVGTEANSKLPVGKTTTKLSSDKDSEARSTSSPPDPQRSQSREYNIPSHDSSDSRSTQHISLQEDVPRQGYGTLLSLISPNDPPNAGNNNPQRYDSLSTINVGGNPSIVSSIPSSAGGQPYRDHPDETNDSHEAPSNEEGQSQMYLYDSLSTVVLGGESDGARNNRNEDEDETELMKVVDKRYNKK